MNEVGYEEYHDSAPRREVDLELDGSRDHRLSLWVKRASDLIVAGGSLIVLAPFMALIAILVRLTSPGPALFVQERVGSRRKHGRWEPRTFRCYKFRTMRIGLEPELHRQFFQAYVSNDRAKMSSLQNKDESESPYKLTNDPRVTSIGAYLRKLSLDELPQLLNVVKGDMSMVGPRPAIPYELEMYDRRSHQRRAATPGITGLWQVNGRSSTTFDEMIRLDIKYIETRSTWLDIKILLATIPTVLSGRGE